MFTEALFTIAKVWKQPKCSSRDEWIKKMWHIYTMEYYSALEGIMLSEVSQTKTNTIGLYLYMESKNQNKQNKMITNS